MMNGTSSGAFMSCVVACVMYLAQAAGTSTTAAPECSAPTVRTTGGRLCGITRKTDSGSVRAYLGIRYGRSPAGAKRWTPPVPTRSHAGVFSATELGPSCPQKIGSESSYLQSEDCLSLNVWRPRRSDKRRPVMVFIHGGAFVEGTSASALYDGANLSAAGNVVVVTFNYRLGALGFLYGVEDLKGNYGFLDQQLALRWVRDNIARFGGDPRNVILFGESAGAMSIGLHLVAPASRNLFRAAIMQSNPYGLPYRFADETHRTGKKMRGNLGCAFDQSERALECMRQAPLQRILKYQSSPGLLIEGALSGFSDLLLWGPHIDGRVIARQPVTVRLTKPVIIGTNAHEGLTFAALLEERSRTISRRAYRAALGILFSRKTARLIRRTPRYKPQEGDNTDVFARVATDFLFTCASRYVLSRARSKAFGYEFTKQTSYDVWPGLVPCAPGGKISHACHGFELPYVFGNPTTLSARQGLKIHTFEPHEKELSRRMMAYWTRFAARHNPNSSKAKAWPVFTPQRPYRQVLDTPIKTKQDSDVDCSLWDKIGYGQSALFGRL